MVIQAQRSSLCPTLRLHAQSVKIYADFAFTRCTPQTRRDTYNEKKSLVIRSNQVTHSNSLEQLAPGRHASPYLRHTVWLYARYGRGWPEIQRSQHRIAAAESHETQCLRRSRRSSSQWTFTICVSAYGTSSMVPYTQDKVPYTHDHGAIVRSARRISSFRAVTRRGRGGGGGALWESRCWANVQSGAQGRKTHHGPTAAGRSPPCAGDWASPASIFSILKSCAMTTSSSTNAYMHASLQTAHVQKGAHSSRMS